jgi:ABC-2 type transport system permease protein
MSVSWRDVARKDFEDAVRSRLLWGLTVAFVGLLSFFLVVGYVTGGGNGDADAVGALTFIGQFASFFIPLIALIAGYMAIVGERQSGSLRVLMSYPFSRGAVVFGKLVGRSVVVGVTILAGLVVMIVLAAALTGSFPFVEFVEMVALTLALGLAFTGIAVGISATTRTRGKALALVVSVFFLLLAFWEAIAVGAYFLVNGTRPGLTVDAWYLFLYQLNPIDAYRFGLMEVVDGYIFPFVQLGLEDYSFAEVSGEQLLPSARVEGSVPFYLKPWFSVVTFLGWAIIPVLIGYQRFRSSDVA